MRREVARIDRALAAQQDLDASVHEARKAIRQLRALLGLCRGRLPGLERIDARLRSLGSGLSRLRDARASIDTARKMAALQGNLRWESALERLLERRQRVVAAALATDPGFAKRRARLAGIAAALEACDWEAVTASRLRREYKSRRKRVEKAERRARNAPTAHNLHRWRRRLRTLRMQLDVVCEVLPERATRARAAAAPREAKALRRQIDALGWRQDLEVLRGLLRPMRALPAKPELLAGIGGEIARLEQADAPG